MPNDTGDDRRPISLEREELDYLLASWRKASTDANRRALSDALTRFLKDPDWGPHSRERFSQFADARGLRRILSDMPPSPPDDHPYTVIRDWALETGRPPEPASGPLPSQSATEAPEDAEILHQEPDEEEESPLPPPLSPISAGTHSPETLTMRSSGIPQTPHARSLPPAPTAKKRRPPLFFIIGGLVIAVAILIILLLVKRGVDASGVAAPIFMFNPQAEIAPSPQSDSPETSLSPADRFTRVVRENSPVYFIADLETWLPGEEAKLDRILAELPNLRSAALTVTGHTAEAGKPNAQFVLSVERAIAVREYLLKRRGGSVLSVTIIGRGANDPAVSGAVMQGGTEQGPNRRAEISVDRAE